MTKYAYYSTLPIAESIVGQNVPLGNIPLTFLNQNGASNIPTLFSVIESTEYTVLNVLTGVESITTTSDVVNVALLAGQSIVVNIIKAVGTWGTMTLSPVVSWATITSTVGNTVTITINADNSGTGDYAAIDYNSIDYLTSGINSLVGNYSFDLLENAVDVGDINVSIYTTLQIRSICKSNSLNFAFLNRSGGWSSYAIECKYIKGSSGGTQSTFLTTDNVLKASSLDNVFETYTLNADLLTTFELDLLEKLRTSIQCYLYNDASLAFDIPILINKGSFELYGNRQKQTERSTSFSFTIATKDIVQTQ